MILILMIIKFATLHCIFVKVKIMIIILCKIFSVPTTKIVVKVAIKKFNLLLIT